MDINKKIAGEIGVREAQVDAAVKLIDEGNTIPFIARYRKEATGALNDEQLRDLFDRLTYLRNLEERKETIIASITEQEKMTPELKAQIEAAETLVMLEDLYRPYKPKRRTRATIAKEKGLEPLADLIFAQDFTSDITAEAAKYINPEKEVATAQDAISGAKDIIAEAISDVAEYRTRIRALTEEKGILATAAKDKEAKSVYEMYYEYEEAVQKIPGHRILAINRGEKEKFLTVKLNAPEEDILRFLEKQIIKADNATTPIIKEVIDDAYHRLIQPSIENEIRSDLKEKAEDAAIVVFGKNCKQLLMQPPIAGKVVLGWDPAFRTGCKLSVVDGTGNVLDTAVIYPTQPQNKVAESKAFVKAWIKKYGINLISLGNGTASRESEQIIVELLKEIDTPVQYVIVNEAGASVYSASKLATEEFPNFDVGQRSATSMARRLQDPLAELVKMEPKSLGVGQYQHDMNQKKLSDAIGGVVEGTVNEVGVDLNTASVPLLSYVAGVSNPVAKNIVAYRQENGSFKNRKELLKVPKLGPKAFEQCAGFLRIREGDNILDNTGVHPESYKAAAVLLKKYEGDVSKLPDVDEKSTEVAALAAELGVGELTLVDIIRELKKPGRDPREDMPAPILRSDVMDMKDLKPGMVLKGTVRNIVDFGAFVDIGVHEDGLVHISHMSQKFIKHPMDVVSVGDIVDVEVLDVDEAKGRISLSMRIGAGDTAGDSSAPKREKKADGSRMSAGNDRKPHGDSRNKDRNNNRNSQRTGDFRKTRDNRDNRDNRGNGLGTMASLFKDIKL